MKGEVQRGGSSDGGVVVREAETAMMTNMTKARDGGGHDDDDLRLWQSPQVQQACGSTWALGSGCGMPPWWVAGARAVASGPSLAVEGGGPQCCGGEGDGDGEGEGEGHVYLMHTYCKQGKR